MEAFFQDESLTSSSSSSSSSTSVSTMMVMNATEIENGEDEVGKDDFLSSAFSSSSADLDPADNDPTLFLNASSSSSSSSIVNNITVMNNTNSSGSFDPFLVSNSSSITGGSGVAGIDDNADYNVTSSIVTCLSWLLFTMYCCCTRRRPASTEQGDRIRQRAREAWRRQELEREKQGQNPEDRKELVQLCMRTKKVIAKDEDGNLRLGPVDSLSTSCDSSCATDLSQAQSTDSADAYNDDDEQACVICLEPFQVNDIVSWSRQSIHRHAANAKRRAINNNNSSSATAAALACCYTYGTDEYYPCHHVFHTECIEPWVIERRQDDCPSCRSPLILTNLYNPKKTNRRTSSSPNDENNESTNDNNNSNSADTQNDEAEPQQRIPVREQLEELLAISFDDEDALEEEQDQKGESIFVIMHGMISRVAKSAINVASSHGARYELVDSKDSMDQEDYTDPLGEPNDATDMNIDADVENQKMPSGDYSEDATANTSMSTAPTATPSRSTSFSSMLMSPSPLRRVVSHDPKNNGSPSPEFDTDANNFVEHRESLSGSIRNLFFPTRNYFGGSAKAKEKDDYDYDYNYEDVNDIEDNIILSNNGHDIEQGNNPTNNHDRVMLTMRPSPLPLRRALSEGLSPISHASAASASYCDNLPSNGIPIASATASPAAASLKKPLTLRRRSSSLVKRQQQYQRQRSNSISSSVSGADEYGLSSAHGDYSESSEDDLEWRTYAISPASAPKGIIATPSIAVKEFPLSPRLEGIGEISPAALTSTPTSRTSVSSNNNRNVNSSLPSDVVSSFPDADE